MSSESSSDRSEPAQPAKENCEDRRCLGDYQLLETLHRGRMGTVYMARQQRLKKIVALKVLPKERTSDVQAVIRFQREIEAIGQLSHPGIVQALDAREIGDTHVLVMEYVDGLDLARVADRVGRLRIPDACELVRQTAVGLQCAHEHSLVHRDIKPSNLMLTRQGHVKILDLGLARIRSNQPEVGELTSPGSAMGTADYIAPEQVADARSADIRADIYSLGCTLYKLLTGQVPYNDARHKTNAEKMAGHLNETAPSVRSLRAEITPELTAVIERMMARAPNDRFATPAQVAVAVAPFVGGCDLERLSADVAALPDRQAVIEPRRSGTDPTVSSALLDTSA